MASCQEQGHGVEWHYAWVARFLEAPADGAGCGSKGATASRRFPARGLPAVTTMSFLEHLEELRRRLIVCVVAVVICMAVSWPLVPTVQQFITRPLQEPSITQKWSYILETWATKQFPNLTHRLGVHPEPPKVNPHRLNYMAPLEPFFVQMKVAMITGLSLAFPLILYQMWLFFAPALYPQEKKIIYYFLPIGTVAFVLGDFFFLKLVWPLIISFSLRYESEFLFSMLNLTQFVNFCLRLLLLFGLIFELPLILLILARVGIVRVDFLRRQRRVAILLSAVVAAFHADVLTMAAIAMPLYAMYELSILAVRVFGGPYSRGDSRLDTAKTFPCQRIPQALSRRNRLTRAPGRSCRSRAPTCRAKPACFNKMPPARTNSTGAPGRANCRAQSAPSSASDAAASARIFRAVGSPFAAAAKTVGASAATSAFSAPFAQSIKSSASFNCNACKMLSPKAGHRPLRSISRPPPAEPQSDLIAASPVAQNMPPPAEAHLPPCVPLRRQNNTTLCR